MTLNITDAELHEWAKMRADDAGRLARELVACRRQSQATVAAAYEAAAQVVLGSNLGLDISDIADDVRALATPDQIAALAASPDTIPLPRAEVEALMEAAETLADNNVGYAAINKLGDGEKNHDVKTVRDTLATLQERMK